MDAFGDIAQELQEAGVVGGLAGGVQVEDLRSLGPNRHVEAQGGLRSALGGLMRQGVGGELEVLRHLLRAWRPLGGLVVNDAVLNVHQVDLAFEGVGDVGEGELKGGCGEGPG